MYVGEAVGADQRFFASSRYLTDRARVEITTAENLETSAHNKYVAQRQQTYQFRLSTGFSGSQIRVKRVVEVPVVA
jgi:hypothetical protein